MATIEQHIIRTYLGSPQYGVVVRNLDTYPKPGSDAAFLAAADARGFDIALTTQTGTLTGEILYAVAGSSGYTGTQGVGKPSSDSGLLNMLYDFSGGRITNLRNGASPTLGSNEIMAYKINSRPYTYIGGHWRKISETGIIGTTDIDLSYPPDFGILIDAFRVNTTRPYIGSSGVPGWFDQPVLNASQLLRVL